ncbi:MAG TPA: ferritin-like protein [Acidimicrobiales bacterium]|nr:ferritin-like protein [Acidimicrobiales bacterium]
MTEPATTALRTRRGHRRVPPITDLEALRGALQTALQLEHATIPPYLCALYSIRPGRNVEAAAVIESVVMEEMLHMVLVANVLNAIGAEPAIDRPDFVPRYPATLPHSDGRVIVRLQRFSPAAVDCFLRIERPEPVTAPPRAEGYHTIGQLYAAIELGLQVVSAQRQIFTGDRERQIAGNDRVYGMAGGPVLVDDLASALHALSIVVDQGEGIDHTIHDGDAPLGEPPMLAHYYRFDEIARERHYRPSDTPRTGPTGPPLPVEYDSVWPMRTDPRASELPPGSDVRGMTDSFNAVYTELLRQLHRGLNGEPDQLGTAVGSMWALRWQAEALLRVPLDSTGDTAGPTFEWAG